MMFDPTLVSMAPTQTGYGQPNMINDYRDVPMLNMHEVVFMYQEIIILQFS